MGDRRRRLRWAVENVAHLPLTTVLSRSRIYETAPVGPSRRPFLNMALKIRTSLTPMGLLVELKRLEARAGRRPGPRWGPRPIDLDILSYGTRRVKTPWLQVPHPRLTSRAFALAPLRDIAPSWKPDGRRTVSWLLRRLNPGPGTVKILPHG